MADDRELRCVISDLMDQVRELTAERDALQARIDGAKVSLVYKSATDTPRGHMNHLPAELIGKRVALVVLP